MTPALRAGPATLHQLDRAALRVAGNHNPTHGSRRSSSFSAEVLAGRAEWVFEDDGSFRLRRVDADDQPDR